MYEVKSKHEVNALSFDPDCFCCRCIGRVSSIAEHSYYYSSFATNRTYEYFWRCITLL